MTSAGSVASATPKRSSPLPEPRRTSTRRAWGSYLRRLSLAAEADPRHARGPDLDRAGVLAPQDGAHERQNGRADLADVGAGASRQHRREVLPELVERVHRNGH